MRVTYFSSSIIKTIAVINALFLSQIYQRTSSLWQRPLALTKYSRVPSHLAGSLEVRLPGDKVLAQGMLVKVRKATLGLAFINILQDATFTVVSH